MQIFKTLDIEIKKQRGAPQVKNPYKDHKSLKELLEGRGLSVVAEIAGGSPLVGKARASFRPSTHAKALLEGGAAALSVATDAYCYFGQDKHLHEVRGVAPCPLIRRDFIFEEFQVEESKALGADAIILIAPLLQPERLKDLHALAVKRRLDVVVEVFDQEDIDNALEAGAQIICAVGRDIDTWEVSWESALRLLKKIPPKKCLRMVEAGVSRLQQLEELESLGAHGVIIGEALLPEFYPGRRLAQILGGKEPPAKSQKAQKGAAPKAQPKPAAKPAAQPKPAAKPSAAAKPPAKKPATGAKVAKVVQSAKAPAAGKGAGAAKKTQATGKTPAPHAQSPDRGVKETSMATTKKADKAATAETEKKATAKKAVPAKKTTSAAKPAAKKTIAAKPAAKKTTAAKPAVKKTTAAKPAVKKTTAAKPAVKKTTAAKPAVKKTTAAKPAVKKAAPKKTAAAKKATAVKTVKKAAASKTIVKKAISPKTAKKAAPARKPCAPKKPAAH
jgi:indole-3-glycerol phosphate synthase